MTELENQRQRIIEYLQQNGSITPMDALNKIGCMRLATRIWELKNWDGYDIKTFIETATNNKGEKKRYARYVLIKKEPIDNWVTNKFSNVSKF
jgi:hypothetical protein